MRRISMVVAVLALTCAAWAEAGDGFFSLRRGLFRKLHGLFEDEARPTRYPIVLAHGICGFDKKKWGPIEIRYFHDIESHLRERGYDVYTTDVPATGSIEERARELARQVDAIGAPKVNIIAHSMGGLDTRYMVSRLGMGDRVATLTMVGTPNHGTLLADWLVHYGSERFPAIEKMARAIGIEPRGFHDISVAHMMRVFNPSTPDDPRVSYRSYAGSQRLAFYFAPLVVTHSMNRALERTAMGMRTDPVESRLLEKVGSRYGLAEAFTRKGFREVLRGLPLDWIQAGLAGKTDGMVSMSSVRRGDFRGRIDADHLDQLGWLTGFDAKGFYENVARDLAREGY